MHGINHVHRRGAVYVWRRRVPKAFGKGRFLQVSLRTRNFSSANRLAAIVNEKFLAFILAVKSQRISHAEAQRFLAAEVAQALTRIDEERYYEPEASSPEEWRTRYFDEKCRSVALRIVAARGSGACLIDEDRRDLMLDGFTEGHLLTICKEIESLRAELRSPDFLRGVKDAAETVIGRDDLSQPDVRASIALRLRARAMAIEASDRRASVGPFRLLDEKACYDHVNQGGEAEPTQSMIVETPEANVAHFSAIYGRPVRETNAEGAVQNARNDGIADLIAAHLDAKNKRTKCEGEAKKIAKDVRQRRSVLRHFSQAISARFLIDLTQSDLAQYGDTMDKIPKIHGKSRADRDRTIHELVERAEDLPEEDVGLSANTKNRNFGIIKDFLTFARAKHGIVPQATLFFEDLYSRPEDGECNERLAFSDDDVTKLTDHPVWREGRCPETGRDGRSFADFGLYWMPIIADLTGMRREEIAGMMLDDVVTDHSIPHFDIRPNRNRRLKNKSSRRCVPIHDGLMELGFRDYVDGLRDRGEIDLFPELKPTAGGSYGGVFYKDWKKVLDEQLGPDLVGKVFHSWRHRFVTLMRNDSAIAKDVVQDIVGHTPQDETDRTYRDTTQFRDEMLARLNPAIQSVPCGHWMGKA
ncbi:site-specific integrase [Roseivivax isoporae]|uniref:site-specific integrase n=1 Tax=Roseivivax isoporae TaxID=591206 RepID=UPI0004B2C739|nr:site-specific integrase [Roseivivax isoporae]